MYRCCILLKGVCELFSAGKWQQYMQWMPNFFGLFVTSLLLSATWFSSTHTYYFPGLVKAPRSVFHSTASDFGTGTNFSHHFFLLGWVTGLWCSPVPGIDEIWGYIIPWPSCTVSTWSLMMRHMEQHRWKFSWSLTLGILHLVFGSVQFCWPRVSQGAGAYVTNPSETHISGF